MFCFHYGERLCSDQLFTMGQTISTRIPIMPDIFTSARGHGCEISTSARLRLALVVQ
jgi:hypothetical protein